jgi:hypothetical protein
MCLVCADIGLSTNTIHLSVRLLDFFMDDHDIVERKLHFVAVGCILVAAKYEETDNKVNFLISALLACCFR